MKSKCFEHKIVDCLPEPLAPSILYTTREGDLAAHLCACGCGQEVITPLLATGWRLMLGHEGASLEPSIGNWTLPCRSHYFITGGRVIWEGDMSQSAIDRGRARDQARKAKYYAEPADGAPGSAPAPRPEAGAPPVTSPDTSIWLHLWNWLRALFR